jgi:hypothetical protein
VTHPLLALSQTWDRGIVATPLGVKNGDRPAFFLFLFLFFFQNNLALKAKN